jgi:hypothetical protein
MENGQKVTQKMIFPNDHAKYPGQPKGIKQVLTERELYTSTL